MKEQKYPESKIKTAQEFLSKYGLSFDYLDANQKKIVSSYTQLHKHLLLILILLILSIIIFSVGAFIAYQSVKYFVGVNCDLSSLENNDDLRAFGKACFALGFTFCLYSSIAFYVLVCIVFIFARLRTKFKILNAFLPSLKFNSDNETISSE